MAAPMTKLLTKEKFHWTDATKATFNQLKQALMTPPTLCLPDFSQPFVVECDASGLGIGAVLTQNSHPVAYFSAALKGTSLTLSTYEKEMLAIVKAIRKWRHYLLGKPFIVRTDHKSLKYLLEQRITTPAQTRWLPKLLGYDYTIKYKKGVENQAANSLSRIGEVHFLFISVPHADWWPQLQTKMKQDPFYASYTSNNTSQPMTLRDGVWFHNDRVFLSPTSSLIPLILADSHSSPVGGHFGFHKTLSRISHSFFWPKLRQTVKEYLQMCAVCQQCKSDCMKPAGLLQPLPILTQI
jgi:hypothetical protein